MSSILIKYRHRHEFIIKPLCFFLFVNICVIKDRMAIFFLYLFNGKEFSIHSLGIRRPITFSSDSQRCKAGYWNCIQRGGFDPEPHIQFTPLPSDWLVFHNQASWIRKIFLKLNRFLCYSHLKCSLPTHLVSSLFSDHNSDQLSRTTQTQGSRIGHVQGINFGWLRANFPRKVFRETSQNNCCPAKCAEEIVILSVCKSM